MPDTSDSTLTGRIPHFFDLLSDWNVSIPIQSQWILFIGNFPAPLINQVKTYDKALWSSPGMWNTAENVGQAISSPYQHIKGCIFAQSVKMPPEGFEIERVGDFKGGWLKGLTMTTRKDFGTFDVSFLETNLSFVDIVLRPWAIMAAYKGLIARPEDTADGSATNNSSSVKTTIYVAHLAKTGAGKTPFIRKLFSFFQCVPCSIDAEEYSYEGEKVIQRQVSFAYSSYTLEIPEGQANVNGPGQVPPTTVTTPTPPANPPGNSGDPGLLVTSTPQIPFHQWIGPS